MKHEPLPEGWLWVRFDEIAYNLVERNGDNPNRTVMAVTKYDGLVPSLEYFDRQVFSDDISKYKVVRPNQFAYAVIHLDEGSIGMNDKDEPILVSPVYVVFGLDERKADPEYFRFLLKSDYMMMTYQRIGEGTVDRRKSITFETLGSAQIPLPPIDEQHRIVEVLRDTDANIARVADTIAAAQEVKHGTMQRLFTYGLVGEDAPTKHTKIGEIPAAWQLKRIGDIATQVTDGEHQTPTRSETGVLLLSARNVLDSYLSLDVVDYVPEDEYQRIIKRCFPQSGDILISCSGTVGRVCEVPENLRFALVRSVALIKFDRNLILSKFAQYMLQSDLVQNQIAVSQSQAAQPNLFQGEIRKLQITVPSMEEQCEISAILSAHDETIRELKAEAASLREVKRGLMQKLLSGQVRI